VENDEESEPAAFMLQAFNSIRFFAWVERTMFRTPYAHGQIDVNPAIPARVRVACRGAHVATLQMADKVSRQLVRQGDETWQGRVYLPINAGKPDPENAKMFFATLSGPAYVYEGLPEDCVNITAHPEFPVLRQLNDAAFRPLQWILRTDGRHKKSKTVPRNLLPHI
jgi:hypothetical protein